MAHGRDGSSFSRRIRVKLSTEGQEKLSPRVPLDGWIRRVEDGLVIVLEASGQENAYHPDFLESA